jgi:hypothetical protein
MNKPELVIGSSSNDEILSGHCSSCPSTAQFRFRGNNLRNRENMRRMFDAHFKRVHMPKDASQVTAQVVEAIEE